MSAPLIQILICLLAGIALIVLLTARFKVHAFFALILACFVVGLGMQMPAITILTTAKDGFGNIIKSLGFLIVLGTTLGVLLEYTGSTNVMARSILRLTGAKRAPLAMSLTGLIVGLPIFCDSGYIVLSGLNHSLAKRVGIPMVIMATCLATGLYAVHCLIPPHPGATAAAGILKADTGRLMLYGTLVALPAMLAAYFWTRYAGRKIIATADDADDVNHVQQDNAGPSPVKAFLPVVVPIALIAAKALLSNVTQTGSISETLLVIGDPVIALAIGILLAFSCGSNWTRDSVARLLRDGAEKAGGILVIIGAGGAFGAILAATNLGQHISTALPLAKLGLFFPFLITALLKTAQGSSTVAIITAASIVAPLLPTLGLQTDHQRLLATLAMGAGSMMISHTNDAYFWVIAKFSGLEMKSMLKTYTVATGLMGITAMVMVYTLSLIIR